METVIADIRLCSIRSAERCACDCLKYADELKNLAVTNIILQRTGSKISPGFGTNPRHIGSELHNKLITHLTNKSVPKPEEVMVEKRALVDRFDLPDAEPLKRWERLTRMIDGKSALKYLGSRFDVDIDQHRGTLARQIREQNRIPADVQGYVYEFLQASIY